MRRVGGHTSPRQPSPSPSHPHTTRGRRGHCSCKRPRANIIIAVPLRACCIDGTEVFHMHLCPANHSVFHCVDFSQLLLPDQKMMMTTTAMMMFALGFLLFFFVRFLCCDALSEGESSYSSRADPTPTKFSVSTHVSLPLGGLHCACGCVALCTGTSLRVVRGQVPQRVGDSAVSL
ncbi:hypothetical protein BHE74_00019229 [Ensete ventricosum]|nr:hypothetical protein BHE74_00019229 [Ensete ventricosum]